MGALGTRLRTLEGGLLSFWCPGCKTGHHVRPRDPDGKGWTFNGNADAPTFSPSVLVTWTSGDPPVTPENFEEYKRNPWPQTKKHNVCHSFVTDGRIQFLNDCTHPLAGQTVPLPDFPVGE